MDDARVAPVATTSEMEMPSRCSGLGTACARPRLPSRMKIGDSMSAMTMLEMATRSKLAPSTISSEMPEVGRRPGHKSGRANIVQLLTVMFLKSPLDSVPSLKQLHAVVSTQLVTVTFSVARR